MLTVERDPETGLAALPENYIWRVFSDERYLTLMLVKVTTETKYRPKWLFFGREGYEIPVTTFVMEEFFDSQQIVSHARNKEAVANGLALLSEKMYRHWKSKQDQADLLRTFSGDYPPKNLNSV